MVVPLPPGSAPDVRHRLIAQALTQLWGQQVIVENPAWLAVAEMLVRKL